MSCFWFGTIFMFCCKFKCIYSLFQKLFTYFINQTYPSTKLFPLIIKDSWNFKTRILPYVFFIWPKLYILKVKTRRLNFILNICYKDKKWSRIARCKEMYYFFALFMVDLYTKKQTLLLELHILLWWFGMLFLMSTYFLQYFRYSMLLQNWKAK